MSATSTFSTSDEPSTGDQLVLQAEKIVGEPPNSAKKLVIKNFERPQLPEQYADEAWAQLRGAVVAIQQSQHISTSHEELYQAVENLCSHKMAPQLYDNLRSLCEQHVRSALSTFSRYPSRRY
ncbi:hypothetical protein MRX96_010120 [Rhipicephalus microplus]